MSYYGKRDMGFWYHQEYDPTRNGSMDGTDIYPHDHGLQRASRCHYDSKKDPSISVDPYKTLFVGRLRPQTTEETIRGAFARYGPIQSIHLVRDIITGYSRGYAFVEYKYEEDFTSAFYAGHRLHIDGSQILVDYMREQTIPGWIPRRLGGGVGGKKQSGQMRFGGRDCPFRVPFNSTLFSNQHNHNQERGQRNTHDLSSRNDGRSYQSDSRRRDERGSRPYQDDRRSKEERRGGPYQDDSRRDDRRYREERISRREEYERDNKEYTYNKEEKSYKDSSARNDRSYRRERSPYRDERHHDSRRRDTSRYRSRSRDSRHRSRSGERRHRHHSVVCSEKEKCSSWGSNPRPSRY